MKTVNFLLEFGQRKECNPSPEQHVSVTIPTLGLAQRLAAGLVRVFSMHIDLGDASNEDYWKLGGSTPRATWQNKDRYIALTRLDGKTKFPSASEQF